VLNVEDGFMKLLALRPVNAATDRVRNSGAMTSDSPVAVRQPLMEVSTLL